MQWERLLANSVKNNQIKELHLSKIPILKTCDNWRNIEPLGWIDHQFKYTHYVGGLVKYQERIFFVPEKTLSVVQSIISLKFKKRITVISDSEN